MTGFGSIQLSAAVAAAACLLCPLAGRLIIKWQAPDGWRRPLHPALLFLALCLLGGATMVVGWADTFTRADAVMLAVISLAIGFGLTGERFLARRAVKVTAQFVLACMIALVGVHLPVTAGAYPVIDGLCTVLLIVGLLNLLVVINFLDGLTSLVVFLLSSCSAIILNLSMGTGQLGDPAGVVFALSLCGLSLWFFIYSRPSSKAYVGDYGTMMLNIGLGLLLIRIAVVRDEVLSGAVFNSPALLLPLLLTIPLLLASVHREQKAFFRRSRLALILILLGHLPYLLPLLTDSPNRVIMTASLMIGSVILWTGVVTQGRMLRGWSMRCMAEPIADTIWIAARMLIVSLVVAWLFGISAWVVVGSVVATSGLLMLQVAFWRRNIDAEELPEVVIFGRHEDYRKAQFIFLNCEDLFGRRRARRSRIGLNSKHLRSEVMAELKAGHTCLILARTARASLLGLQSYEDLIFAGDCLLLRHLDETIRPRRIPHVVDFMQDATHRLAALIGILFFAPVCLAVAAAIRLEDGGPIFFRQRRLGQSGRRFTLYKFRSMRVDAPRYGESPTTSADARVTRVGRIIRKLSIDELPQLINVLRGDMRLVGPRPEMPFICSRYTPHQRQRLLVPAGVTGLWQISPHRNAPIHDHVEYDLAYAQARGPVLDAAVIIATLLSALKSGF
ncbi:MAG: sugar transferase [Phycisphaerales bacterium]|nr:sugar transferase [Phycisphaerales bacterium]